MEYCVWPDGFYCQKNELEYYGYLSDDYLIIEVDDCESEEEFDIAMAKELENLTYEKKLSDAGVRGGIVGEKLREKMRDEYFKDWEFFNLCGSYLIQQKETTGISTLLRKK